MSDLTEQDHGSTPKECFLHSVQRCFESKAFLETFYERFMGSSEEIRMKFRFTDLDKQYQMLQRSLELCAGATEGHPESLRELNERAKTHDRDHLNIQPAMYESWMNTLVDTAGEFDPLWDEEIESAWRKTLGFVVDHMIRKR